VLCILLINVIVAVSYCAVCMYQQIVADYVHTAAHRRYSVACIKQCDDRRCYCKVLLKYAQLLKNMLVVTGITATVTEYSD
jgi:hypothetical protein